MNTNNQTWVKGKGSVTERVRNRRGKEEEGGRGGGGADVTALSENVSY